MNNPSIETEDFDDQPKPPISEETAKRYFRESVQATSVFDEARKLDAAYYHNKQIPARVEAKWRERGQPLVWTNKISPAISGILGVFDAAQTDPKAEPRTPDHQDTADIATKILRYLNDCADTRTIKATLSKDYFIYGTCAMLVGEAAYPGCDYLAVKAIRWSEFFYDPASKEHDFSDAAYLGICTWLDENQVRKLYPDATDVLGNPFGTGTDWLDSKGSEENLWLDRQRRRVRVIEMYFRDEAFEWQRVVYCGSGFLDFGPSAYRDDKGKTICPIIAASFEVDPETRERYGPIAAMRPLQDEYNARRAVLLNEAQNHRIRQVVEGVDPKSKAIAKSEAPKANGVLPYGWDMVSVPDIANGQAQLLAKTEADLDRLAPSSTVLSAMRSQDSGRSRQILQNAGLTEWARSLWYFERLEERMNRHLWFGAKQYMTKKQFIRSTGEHRAAEFIEINVPVGVNMVPDIDEQGMPKLDPATGQMMMKAQPIMEKAIAEMDVDILLDSVPDTVTLQQEANEQILKYAEGLGLMIDDPRFRLAMEMFLTVDKTRQLERYDAGIAKMQQQNGAQMQMQQQMMQMQQELETLKVQSKAQKDNAQAMKAQAEAEQTTLETQSRMMPPPVPFPPQVSYPPAGMPF